MSPTRLADQLFATRALTPRWRPLFTSVPRHHFVPEQLWILREGNTRWRQVSRQKQPAAWHPLVHSDQALTTRPATHLPDGTCRPGVVTARPSLVARVFDLLDPRPGMRLLVDGCDWTAALACAAVGAAQVTVLAEGEEDAARRRELLGAHGHRPRIIHARPLPAHGREAPYDGVLATRVVREPPWAWITQTAPRARIVVPWCTAFGPVGLLRLTVAEDGTAATGQVHGPVDAGPPPCTGDGPAVDIDEREPARTSLAVSAPAEVADLQLAGAFLGTRLPHVYMEHRRPRAPFEQGTGERLHLHDGARSRAVIYCSRPYAVYEWGPRALWQEAARELEQWQRLDRPGLQDLRVRLDQAGVHVSVARAAHTSWTLPPG
ncbi:hypothetical protein ACIBUY_03935 [Streptomyces sp. NPDC050085]|uniref:hypothetical protein n=1 Tax=Streptomyces sp. NPDC050085 TaxID=3365600 RepID=UPI0037B8F0D9